MLTYQPTRYRVVVLTSSAHFMVTVTTELANQITVVEKQWVAELVFLFAHAVIDYQ